MQGGIEGYLPPGARPPQQQRRGLWAAALGVLIFIVTKGKFLLAGLKFGKYLTTGWTMLLMVWTYSLFYGWPFAAGIVLMILIHELGHGAAARMVGLQVGVPVFIPFVGAFIALKERPRSTYEDFIIGAGGPIAGSLAGAACFLVAGQADAHAAGLLRTIGYFTLVMNLFNLIPVWTLDGARMTEAVKPLSGFVGALFLLGVLFFFGSQTHHWNPIALFVAAIAAIRFGVRWWRSRKPPAPPAPGDAAAWLEVQQVPVAEASVTDDQRSTATLTYFALAASLIAAVHVMQKTLPSLPTTN